MEKIKILLIVLLLASQVHGQKNPGYMGKKNVVSISTSIHPNTLLRYGKLEPVLTFGIERSLARNVSVVLGYSTYKITESIEFLNNGNQNFFDDYYHYYYYDDVARKLTPATITGSGQTRHSDISLSIKNYILRKGSIAPFGRFVGFKMQRCSWKHINPNYSSYFSSGSDTTFLMSNGQPGSQSSITFGLFLGRKMMLAKGVTLGWTLGQNFVFHTSVPKSGLENKVEYANRNDFINLGAKHHVASLYLLEFKVEVGYLF